MTSTKTQSELEAPAKVYQVDAVSRQIEELSTFVKNMTSTYVTGQTVAAMVQLLKTDTDKEAAKLADRVDILETSRKNSTKLLWTLFTIVIGLIANTAFQQLINVGR